MSAQQWSVVDIDARQLGEVQSLFQRVFKHALSEGLWRWKYDAGRGVAVGARAPSGELLAHYGGTLRSVLLMGHPTLAVQIGDVMVAQEGRAALSHKGPFGMVVQAFFQRHVGAGTGPVLGFGFPNARHMRLGQRLGHYAQVDKIFELTWPIGEHSGGGGNHLMRSGATAKPVDWADPATALVLDKLWEGMQRDLRGVAVPCRDAAWWRHRYANHPDHEYRCFWVLSRWTRRVLGAVVLRPPTSASATLGAAQPVWELMDWLAPVAQTPAMLRAAVRMVAAGQGGTLMGWFSGTAKGYFSGTGAAEHEVCAVAVTAPNERHTFRVRSDFAPSVADLVGKWWLSGGDTDFR